ncbi:MAG: hypothetical protein LBV67_00320 [Streptococcaceae bacterium]|jgi:hypothetical protein|nr:hypothetical protein [Streptococcaceae bacterium]
MKNALKFYLQMELKNRKNIVLCLLLCLVPIFIFFSNNSPTQNIRETTRSRLTAIKIPIDEYQMFVTGTIEEPSFQNLLAQNNSLGIMLMNTIMQNPEQFLRHAIDYGVSLDEFYEQFATDEKTILPTRNEVALQTAEFKRIEETSRQVNWTGEGFLPYWQRVLSIGGLLIFFLTAIWSSDIFINEIQRKQFSNTLPFEKTQRIFIPLFLRSCIIFVGFLFYTLSAILTSLTTLNVDFFYPIALDFGRIIAVPFLAFLVIYLALASLIILFTVIFTSFIYSWMKDILQTSLLVIVVGSLSLFFRNIFWNFTPFFSVNTYDLLRGTNAWDGNYHLTIVLGVIILYSIGLFLVTSKRMMKGVG